MSWALFPLIQIREQKRLKVNAERNFLDLVNIYTEGRFLFLWKSKEF